jgi:hypothetical protein
MPAAAALRNAIDAPRAGKADYANATVTGLHSITLPGAGPIAAIASP